MRLKRIMASVLAVIMLFVFIGCGNTKNGGKKDSILMKFAKEALQNRLVNGRLDYSSDHYWYRTGNAYDKNKIDVFYLNSTTLVSAKDKDGKKLFYSFSPDSAKVA